MRREFLIDYLAHGNATKAAEAAGYAHPDKQGPRLRKHPSILAAIDEYFHALEMPAREVITRLTEQARAEYADYMSVNKDDVVIVDLKKLLADDKGHLIKSTKWVRTGLDDYTQMIEFYDAHQALVDIGRYHGLFTDRTDLTSGDEPLEPAVKIYLPDNERD